MTIVGRLARAGALLLVREPPPAGDPFGQFGAAVVDLAGAQGSPALLLGGFRGAFRPPLLLGRIGPLDVAGAGRERAEADLDALAALAPDAVVLAGCTGPLAVQQLGVALAVREAEHGLPAGSVAVVAELGAAGLLRLGALPGCSARLAGLSWDGAVAGGAEGRAVARTLLGLAARAAGVPALDAALGERDGAALAADCARARALGFSGRFVRDTAEGRAVAAAFSMQPEGQPKTQPKAQPM